MDIKDRFAETEYLKVWCKNGVFFAIIKANEVSLEIAKECVATRTALMNGKEYPYCIDMRQIHSMSKQARDFFASEEGSKLITASALIIESAVNKIIGNFFLKISKPKIPEKLFTDEEEALNWLNQFALVASREAMS